MACAGFAINIFKKKIRPSFAGQPDLFNTWQAPLRVH
jgi:hypothetical protein